MFIRITKPLSVILRVALVGSATKKGICVECARVNYVVTEENDEGDDDDGKIYNIRSFRGEPLIEAVCVNGIRINF